MLNGFAFGGASIISKPTHKVQLFGTRGGAEDGKRILLAQKLHDHRRDLSGMI